MANPATDAAALVEYNLQRGQIGWALVALIIGMPASWKAMGIFGKFVSRRFDNRDEIVSRLIDAQKEEMAVRMEEARAAQKGAEATLAVAHAIREMAEGVKQLAEARA